MSAIDNIHTSQVVSSIGRNRGGASKQGPGCVISPPSVTREPVTSIALSSVLKSAIFNNLETALRSAVSGRTASWQFLSW